MDGMLRKAESMGYSLTFDPLMDFGRPAGRQKRRNPAENDTLRCSTPHKSF